MYLWYLHILCVLLCSIETIIVLLCENKDIIIIISYLIKFVKCGEEMMLA